VSPVARRAAAALGVPLAAIRGTGPDGRIVKDDVLEAARRDGADGAAEAAERQSSARTNGTASSAPAAAGDATALKGAAAMLARYMDESREIPTATSLRTFTVTVLDAARRRLKDAGHRVSFTHLIGYAVARAVAERMPVMARHFESIEGRPHVIDDGAVNLGIAVDVERADGTRTLLVPVIRDAARLSFPEFRSTFDDLVERTREGGLTADDLQGANVSLTNPGSLGTVASVPRLMPGQGTIVATGAIGFPAGLEQVGAKLGVEKVMTMTSTYDHRVIQGAESGLFLAEVEALLAGAHGFYERVFHDLGVSSGAAVEAVPQDTAARHAEAATGPAPDADELMQAVQAATSLLKAYRTHGHLAARLDPLGGEPEGDPALDPETVGLTPELMSRIPLSVLRTHVEGDTLADALPHLQETYCGTIAYEVEHIASHRQRTWLREKIESGAFRRPLEAGEARRLLRRLTMVDSLERFLHRAYLGQKQFSIEGLDMTVPMVDEMIRLADAQGAREVVIGMAHRGRLNVLAHNLGRAYETIFREFEGASAIEAVTTLPMGGTGDVKYHHGAKGNFELDDGRRIVVRLESNPSHLEYISPVVSGATRALQTTREGRQSHADNRVAVPVILHGDASFPAQGVVAETLNLQALDGYTVGGTIHLIQNNQIGFTTDPDDARSTRWASDLAKGFDVPIIHVNADDVAACIAAVRLAFAYRAEFGHDVLIDLIGYRRWGHNEGDEPVYTQPMMAAAIKAKKPVRDLFAAELVEQGTISRADADQLAKDIWRGMAERHRQLKEELALSHADPPTGDYQLDRSRSPDVITAVPADDLRALNESLLRIPEGFAVSPKLVKQLERREKTLGAEGGIDWAQAEALAFASLLRDGTPIRLTGQDAERGTFSQRHLVLHDARTGQRIAPIQSLPEATAPMELHNSPLSEIACLGFEYGYAIEAPESLVLWEAQFGDFANAAQVIIDQFIVSALAKWGMTSRLTLLLPHGYEGSGPEHSSARLERFLQLSAEGNIRVAYPTTPAQYFHLLRRQATVGKQRPLVIMTPKSLLRLPQAVSRVEHLSEGQFFPVLPEPRVDEAKVQRLILCTGKLFYDLKNHATREGEERVAISRVELLYPFPQAQIEQEIGRYPNLREVLWVQEEPRNMGAREHMTPRLLQILPPTLRFGYVGRPERASTGEGYPAAHTSEQNRIIRTALDVSLPVSMNPAKAPGER
jgi:2-oxoglutarate decarboxylase